MAQTPIKFRGQMQFALVWHLTAIIHVVKYNRHTEMTAGGNRDDNSKDKIG